MSKWNGKPSGFGLTEEVEMQSISQKFLVPLFTKKRRS